MIPRWYQKESVDAIWNAMKHSKGRNGLVVLPTGSGKSLVLAEISKRVIEKGKRVVCVAHRKELLAQNYAAFKAIAPEVNASIYSAGLNSKETDGDIVFAGIASIYKKPEALGERVMCLIDEAHLVPNKSFGMYRTFIDNLVKYNKFMYICGLTATPFRLQDGPLCDGEVFDEILYSVPLRKLIDEGFLSSIVTPQAKDGKEPESASSIKCGLDFKNIKSRSGEFIQSDVEGAFLGSGVTERIVGQIIEHAANRNSVLIFSSGIMHAKAIQDCFKVRHGIDCRLVLGDTIDLERSTSLNEFKNQKYKFLVNVDVLTTGFDAKNIDCLAIIRATQSAGLFAQMIGRGLRIWPGKENCLLLDFGGNLDRHGSLDSDRYGMIPSSGQGDSEEHEKKKPLFKDCPDCKLLNAPSNLWCLDCGYRFPDPEIKNIRELAVGTNVFEAEKQTKLIDRMAFSRHYGKIGKLDTLRVDFYWESDSFNRTTSIWLCVEHTGYAREKAELWWSNHCVEPMPETIDECIELFNRNAIANVKSIVITFDGKYWKVVKEEIEDIPPKENWASLDSVYGVDWSDSDCYHFPGLDEIPF